MVKADLTRDYYGDLELAPTADVAEIKKQFKKLGKSPFRQFWYCSFIPSRSMSICLKFESPFINESECRSAGCFKVIPPC
jgi:hypothetical protein